MLNFDYYIKGAPALIEYFKVYIGNLGYIKLLSTDKYAEGDDSVFFESTVETAGGIAQVYDVFVMRDGKIWRHFAGIAQLHSQLSGRRLICSFRNDKRKNVDLYGPHSFFCRF